MLLFPLPEGNSAEAVRIALAESVQQLAEHLWRSLTWDQGKEMAQHTQFTIDTGVQVYFFDPKSPWAARLEREHQRARWHPPVFTKVPRRIEAGSAGVPSHQG